ncbi:thermostable hemolysin [Thalassotalea sediminis]|uniref:thermostable hemolysin n=1 Tax=Thalassotalea sediminis TaxID=1759089 RepID=UPI002572E6E4|nr:thermostable hemolysin [Thalassotalea sediminis]
MLVQETMQTNGKNVPVKKQARAITFDLYDKNHAKRKDTEAFVANGFKAAYNADINHFLPMLLQLTMLDQKAVLGLRSATSTLFIEQYLPRTRELMSYFHPATAKQDVIEIGNLHSSNKALTAQLLLVTAVALFMCEKKYMVFSATAQVRHMLTKTGINLESICKANKAKLVDSAEHWGSYYQTSPEVIVVDLHNVMNVVSTTSHYHGMFRKLSQDIAKLSNQLRINL